MVEEIAAFPEFTAITMANKNLYLRRMVQYPPISDLSLATLMMWWSCGTNVFQVSLLNDNLVIYYEGQSERGMSLIGYRRIEESVETILDECKRRGEPERLIHVPEFVVNGIGSSNLFRIEEEMGYREYLVPVSNLYPLEGIRHERRRKVKRICEQIAGEGLSIDVVSLDLREHRNKELMIKKLEQWNADNSKAVDRNEIRVIENTTLSLSEDLGIRNLCLFIGSDLHGFQLYQLSHDGRYFILNHLKVSHAFRFMVCYMELEIGRKAAECGVDYLNFEMDLDVPGLRTNKSELKPSGYFKKFSIERFHA